MEVLDIIIGVPIAWFGYKGYQNGLIKEVFSLVGFILAVFFSFHYLDLVKPWVLQQFDVTDQVGTFLAGILIFIGILIVTQVTIRIVAGFFKVIQLSILDHLAGLIFGSLKAGILVSALLIFLANFQIPKPETREASTLYPYVIQVSPVAYSTLSWAYPGAESFAKTIEESMKDFNPFK